MNNGFVPVLKKPTRVAKNTATAIDHIITNSLLHRTINTGIIKLDISDHFPIFLITETEKTITLERKVQITKLLINNKTKEKFKNTLHEMKSINVISSKQTNSAYAVFLHKFTSLYNKVIIYGYDKIENAKNPVDNKKNSKVFKNKAKSI